MQGPQLRFAVLLLAQRGIEKGHKKHLLVIEDRICQTGAASFSFLDELLGELEGFLVTRRARELTSYRR